MSERNSSANLEWLPVGQGHWVGWDSNNQMTRAENLK